jgi:branched-chain amino acid transport system permease protein
MAEWLSTLPQQIANGLVLGAVYALFALGYALIFGVLDILNLAHGAIFMLGAFVALQLMVVWGWPLLLALGGALVTGGCLGLLLDHIAFYPLRRRGAGYLSPLISSIAMALIFENVALTVFGPNEQRFPVDAFPDASFGVAGATVTVLQVAMVAVAALLTGGLWLLLRRTRLGLAIRTVAASPRAAHLAGIDVERTIAVSFFLASAMGAAAGVLFGLNFTVSWDMGANIQLRGLAVIILGGMDSIPGTVLAGLVLGLAEELGVSVFSSSLRDAVAFGLLFLILVLRPSGLLGRRGLRAA